MSEGRRKEGREKGKKRERAQSSLLHKFYVLQDPSPQVAWIMGRCVWLGKMCEVFYWKM